MDIGIDLHGVITEDPKFFSGLTKLLVNNGHCVHIITGSRKTEELEERLISMGIQWTHFFSISDHHHRLGTPMTGYEEGQPKIDDETWNKSKGWYCGVNAIDLHIDDSPIYGQHFITPYCQYTAAKDLLWRAFLQS